MKMLGRDIEISREKMLSDGYCLSTVKNAERISADGDYVVDNPESDTPGVIWLKGHVKYCRQCWCANAYKAMLIDYLAEQHPGMATAYHQGRLSKDILRNGFLVIQKKNRELVKELRYYVSYNSLPPNEQGFIERQRLINLLERHNDAHLPIVKLAQVIRIDVELIFDAWQLVGSEPDYDKDKLVIDWERRRIMTPFQDLYLSFSEGINDHLVAQFFDNMPGEMIGGLNVRGLFSHVDDVKKTYFISEHSSSESGLFDKPSALLSREQEESQRTREFLWIAVFRAMQDGVFSVERGADTNTKMLDSPSPWVKNGKGGGGEVVAPFYMVRSNPKKSFRDPTRVYGHRHVNWSHRWNVTGHWRHYKDGRKVWISNYVKGPDGKPLVPSVRVYSGGGLAAVSLGLLSRFWRFLIRRWPGS